MPAPQVTVLPEAVSFMRLMVRFSAHPDGGFRLGVEPGGCAGFSCNFTIETQPLPGDTELVLDGLRLFLPADTCRLLDGATVNYTDTRLHSGLTVINPSTGACACSAAGAGAPAQATVALESIQRR